MDSKTVPTLVIMYFDQRLEVRVWNKRKTYRGIWWSWSVEDARLDPEPEFVNLLRSPGIGFQPGRRPLRQPYLTYRPAKLHRLAESIPWNRFLGSLNVYKFGLWILYIIYRWCSLLSAPGNCALVTAYCSRLTVLFHTLYFVQFYPWFPPSGVFVCVPPPTSP